MISTLLSCGEQYRRRYVLKQIRPPGVALHIGSATHKGVEENLKEKARSGKLLPLDSVTDAAVESFKNRR